MAVIVTQLRVTPEKDVPRSVDTKATSVLGDILGDCQRRMMWKPTSMSANPLGF